MVVLVMRSSEAHYASIPARLLVNGVRIIECQRVECYSTLRYMQEQAAKYTRASYKHKYMRYATRRKGFAEGTAFQVATRTQKSRRP